jgi:prepilin peptidase CpaA
MEQLEALGSAAFAIGVFGGVHDLLTRRIPNWLTVPAIVLGLLARFWLLGGWGSLNGFLGLICGFGLFFPIFATGFMGAGDVKLQMAVGAWLGWRLCLEVAFLSVMVGGVYALFEVVFRGRFKAVLRNGYSFLRALLVPGLEAEKLRVDESRKFAFGICIAVAVALTIFLERT